MTGTSERTGDMDFSAVLDWEDARKLSDAMEDLRRDISGSRLSRLAPEASDELPVAGRETVSRCLITRAALDLLTSAGFKPGLTVLHAVQRTGDPDGFAPWVEWAASVNPVAVAGFRNGDVYTIALWAEVREQVLAEAQAHAQSLPEWDRGAESI